MLFNTLDFLIFFAAVAAVFAAVGRKYRRYVLLAASLFFYGYFDVRILALLVLTVFINFLAVDRMHRSESARNKKIFLGLCLAANLGFLLFFKFFGFLSQLAARAAEITGRPGAIPVFEILLPAGISFYTFQIISYAVDVYRGILPPENSFVNLLLFITYFPKLTAGPIERASRLLPVLSSPPLPSRDQVASGLALAAWGIFKKAYIADNLSPIVNSALTPGAHLPSLSMSLGAILFAAQIYADFSGYTDVARGISRLFGIELVLNFNLPFLSPNPGDFWRRWHITVGAFFRDYIYIPLGGSRYGIFRHNLNIVIVWFLGGLWHGASVGFFVWGLYCGFLIVLYNICSPWIEKIAARGPAWDRSLIILGRIYTFITFSHGLLLFRVVSIAHLKEVASLLVPDVSAGWVSPIVVFQALFYLWPLIVMQIAQAFRGEMEILPKLPAGMKLIVFTAGAALFLLFGAFHSDRFFYFQF